MTTLSYRIVSYLLHSCRPT